MPLRCPPRGEAGPPRELLSCNYARVLATFTARRQIEVISSITATNYHHYTHSRPSPARSVTEAAAGSALTGPGRRSTATGHMALSGRVASRPMTSGEDHEPGPRI